MRAGRGRGTPLHAGRLVQVERAGGLQHLLPDGHRQLGVLGQQPAAGRLARRCGYNSALGTGQLRGTGLCQHCDWAETIPPRNPYLLRAPIEVASVGTTWSPATFEKIVTGAQQHGGGWIIFTIHDVCAPACALGVTRPELDSVLGWLARHAGHG